MTRATSRWLTLAALFHCLACSSTPLIEHTTSEGLNEQDAAIPPKHVAGEACDGDDACESAHCSNKVCCDEGQCCRDDEDCPEGAAPMCNDAATCQGQRGATKCVDNRCKVMKGVEDDTGCDRETEADACGGFKSVFCSGQVRQTAPRCKTSCGSDDDCDKDLRCNESGACVPLSKAGQSCVQSAECASAHCVGGMCCEGDDCCARDEDCDATKFAQAAKCDEASTCQGSKGVARCTGGKCTTQMVDDDSACTNTMMATMCNGTAVMCSGGATQQPPPACGGSTCTRDTECPRTNYCKAGATFFSSGMCVPDLPDGQTCDRAEVCQSGHCDRNKCCDFDCCATAPCPGMDCSMVQCAAGMQ